MTNEILLIWFNDLLHLAFWWLLSGLFFSLLFFHAIMGPYHWAKFQRWNLAKKFFVWAWRSKFLLVGWPIESAKLMLSFSDRPFCRDQDVLYKIPLCRLIGHITNESGNVWFYQIGDRYIKGSNNKFIFCDGECILAEMLTNPNWSNPDVLNPYFPPWRIGQSPMLDLEV